MQDILCYFSLAGVLGRLLFLFSCVVVAVASGFRLTSNVSVFVGPIVRVDSNASVHVVAGVDPDVEVDACVDGVDGDSPSSTCLSVWCGGCRTGPRCHASGESTISLVFSASHSFALCVVAKPLLVLGFVFASCAGTTEQQRLQEELEELSKAKARERDNGSRRGSGSWDAHGDGGWAGTLNLFCLLLAAAEAATGLQN